MMPPQSQKLTAETLLAAPRSSPPVPNDDGTLGLYTVSTHTIGGETAREVRVMDLGDGSSLQLSADDKVHDVNWIPGSLEELIYLRTEEKKGTQVFLANARDVLKQHQELVKLDAPISNVKLKQLAGGTVAFVFTGLVGEDGRLFNDEVTEKKSTGRVFDSYNIRVWNQLYKEHLYGLWYTTLSRRNQTWTLSNTFHNVLHVTTLELAGLYDTSETTDNFALSPSGIAFIARDAANRDFGGRLDTHTYFSSLSSFDCPPPGKPVAVSLPAGVGVGESTCVRVAPDESTLGFLHAPTTDVYNRRLYVARIGEYIANDAFLSVPEAQDETIYEPPTSFEFAGHPRRVILQREHHGRDILVHLDLDARSDPRPVTTEGAVKAYTPLKHGNWDVLLVTSSSHIDSSLVQIIDGTSGVSKPIFSATKYGASFGLSRDVWSDLYFRGSDGLEIHAFIIRPSNFDPTRKYPWVLMPHGGPVSAWTDSWSTRWNLASWAEQGYIVICPNISGSTGFGLAFAKRINDQWGGKPCEDLLHLIRHLGTLPCLDQSKGVLAGASYGAYLAGWLMGHEVIEKFCCVVWHSGIFNIPSFMLQTEFPTDDAAFGNRPPFPWLNAEGLQKYNPSRPELLANWGRLAPPTLVIHSDKDYRCPVTEGLAMFAALQAQGVPSRFLTFEDECHWVLKPENSLIWYRTVWDWVRKCMSGDIKRGDKAW